MADQYNFFLEKNGEYGNVTFVQHPIVKIDGLPGARPSELIIFESGQKGEVFSINKDGIEALVFSHEPVASGVKVSRTDQTLSVPVGNELLGQIINPLGELLFGDPAYVAPKEEREVDIKPPGIYQRARIDTPFMTGVAIVDVMIPIGKGQRELVIGDRKTGKSSFLLSAAKTHVQTPGDVKHVAIYAAIAKKKSDIKKLEQFCKEQKIADSVIIVATSSYDSPSMIYLTPYTAMTLAEFYRDQGNDVLLILDDLSTHARFYREMSLLGRRFPGRDSYPGDIFYTHARLLERAGNFKLENGGSAAITCLPVIETVEGDLTGYIQTNLMGVTDGHIFFDPEVYYRGQRPAVNIPLSVTRVGRQTQSSLKRQINQQLGTFIAKYERVQNLSHFGAELTDDVKSTLKIGDQFFKFFNQPVSISLNDTQQIVLFGIIWINSLPDTISFDQARLNFVKNTSGQTQPPILKTITDSADFEHLVSNVTANKEELVNLCLK